MTWRMTVESEIASLSIPLQYLLFSHAYLDSASRLCAVLKRSSRKSNYARGSVVLYLTFHAIELFLKGAILERSPNTSVKTHDVEALRKRYNNLYPGMKYAFHAPFISEEDEADLNALLGPEVIKEFQIHIKNSKQNNPWHQRHQYPRNLEGQPWAGAVGFEAGAFLVEIQKLKAEIARLKNLIFHAKTVSKGRVDKRRVPEPQC